MVSLKVNVLERLADQAHGGVFPLVATPRGSANVARAPEPTGFGKACFRIFPGCPSIAIEESQPAEIHLDGVIIDLTRGRLTDRSGMEVSLRPKSLDLLLTLARNPGRVLSRDELFDAVWPNVTVTEDSIAQCVREVRRAIGDPEGKVLRTIMKRGYRLEVEAQSPKPCALDTQSVLATEHNRPSLIVLPFQSSPKDPSADWFADGIVEEITTALSRFRSLFVIARNSAFTLKGQSVDVREVGRRLNVRYVLEGSVRQAGEKLRVTSQLVEAETRNHVWAERFDGGAPHVFELQDQITTAVAGVLEPRIRRAEIERATRKPTSNLTAYDLYMRALPGFYARIRTSYEASKSLLERAIAQDPGFAQGRSMLARFWTLGLFAGWEPDVELARSRAISLAREALASDSSDPLVLARCGYVLTLVGGMNAEGAALLDQAIAANPNCAEAYNRGGWVSVWNGDLSSALSRADMSERLDPLSPEATNCLTLRAAAHFFSRRYDAAIEAAERALGLAPEYNVARRFLIASLAHASREGEARAQTEELMRRDPRCTLAITQRNIPYRHDWMIEHVLEGLRRAGVPRG
jgi:adenylate cyclase